MYSDEFYELEQALEGVDGDIVLMVLGIIGVILLVVGLFALVSYILQSVGLYTLAKRRGIDNPWLAWIPVVGGYWIAGSIADQYRLVTEGSAQYKRMILLGLNVASFVLGFMSTFFNGMFWTMTEGATVSDMFSAYFASGSLIGLVISGISIAIMVFWHCSLYELYSSCNPKNNVLFLVLGIIFGFLVPFLIFACRNRDDGMPARREELRYEYRLNADARDYREPWDNP